MDPQLWLNDGERAMVAVVAHALPPLPHPSPISMRPVGRPRANHTPVPGLERVSVMETRRHGRRLAAFSGALGRHVNLSEVDLRVLRIGSLLHDVGKNAVPPQVLFKCGRLSAEEFAAVKCHPIIGDLLCARVPGLASVRPIVRHHHERLDGSGYPDGLRGDQIPLLAQIVCVVDVYDALVCPRPYKPAYDSDHALDILRREVELGWRRPDLVAAWIEVIESGAADWRLIAAAV
jgi:putative two-component system response regulator